MSNVESPVEAVLAERAGGAAGKQKAPGGLIAICVIVILLGGLGLLMAIWGVIAALFTEQIQGGFAMGPMPAGPGVSQEMTDLMEEMQDKINAVVLQYRWHNLGIFSVQIVVAALLLAGGIRTLRLRPQGRTLLMVACSLAIVFEFGRAILQTIQTMQTFTVMNNYLPQMMDLSTQGGSARIPIDFFTTMMKVMMYVGVAFGLAFVLAKVIFYVITIKYLNNPPVTALFQAKTKTA